ncbi:MAG TPA: hypothetical protein V6D35_08995 [Candidatus Sericytochromatia bacterium]
MFFKLLTFIKVWFFSAEQQQRLSDLMNLWRTARDRGQTISPEQQVETHGRGAQLCAPTNGGSKVNLRKS